VTSSKQPGLRTRRRSSSKRPPPVHQPARQPAAPLGLTDEWWQSWRRANALGWDYINALSGLFRVNVSALTGATRFMRPFPLQ
jgi:hypothetical protein